MKYMSPEMITEMDEWEASIDSISYNKESVPFLIKVLKTTNDRFLINKLAITLGDIKNERAVKPIVDLLAKKENETPKGNLLTALQQFDYSPYEDLLFDLFLNGNYEVSCKAYEMLIEIMDQLSDDRKKKIEQKIEDYKDDVARLESFLELFK